ncbi:hypothetical protein N0B31_07520 [Salinirubellus salinus]|uniref:Uncharacterized protein n=1 Tax=Salinirubellus salinus TaxID=1364945 RepID=A0A9E7U9N7_9EURY|nr:hypothetical protein [Salinirubellus salinus]UWM56131.1 hypothetical protein N0B31_07520 [Salinirubellus salinus]
MVSDTTPDYCPFCGARLRDEGGAYGAHLHRHDDCRERAEAWATQERGPASPWTGDGGSATLRLGLGAVVALVVLAYAVLVMGQLLVGLLAAGIVLGAFWYGPALV